MKKRNLILSIFTPLLLVTVGCNSDFLETEPTEFITQEQLGDAALLVDPKDERQIALAIRSLYENSEFRNTLIQRGLARTSKWTGYDYIRGLLSILDELEPFIRCWSA